MSSSRVGKSSLHTGVESNMKATTTVGMHPMLSSVVHLPFQAARKDIGCCEFAEQDFNRSITVHLNTLSREFPIESLDTHKLWQSMTAGEVIAVECKNTETFIFHVRGKISSKYVDMRFSYYKDDWSIEAITSIHNRPIWRSPSRRLYLGMTGGVVLAGLAGFLLAGHGPALNPQNVQAWASANGYQLVKKDPAQTAALSANMSPNQNGQAAANAVGQAKTAKSGTGTTHSQAASNPKKQQPIAKPKPAVQTFTFDLRPGMTVHDISVYLAQHHLVPNAIAFDQVLKNTGVDKKVWPGTYTFKSGMNQNQILQELQSKPSH